ncbi:PadR family transcriptional regulator [Psychrobacillus sp. FSL H8-0483]|uniref:PadR family transcriptional regulator n=1 Tax=Psychrobacillus sp. FSL H8-0483 TaxID=2921389 RepID=UPI003159BAEE
MAYTGAPMTEAMYYVLLALVNPNHGYSLMNTITEISRGRVEMGPGTLYGVLSRIQKEGLITLSEDDGRRKTYTITADGKEALRNEYNRLVALVDDGIFLKEGDENGKGNSKTETK